MIRLLDDALVNQIAAGEVVERPASVVKELLENALDAGATTVSVLLRDGGRALIRVVDDGSGMGRDDALMCIERHATSKIRSLSDLLRVGTLGFRGEALPSIASVSRFQLVTRPHDAEIGTRVRVEGGQLVDVTDAGCAAGTEIDVRGLFYNIPARRKFLRTATTELQHCVENVAREAFVRPDVDLTVRHEGRDVLRAPRVDDRAARARDLLGEDGAKLMPVSFEAAGFAVEGLVGPAGVHRSSSTGAMYLYVNGRFVRDPVVRRAVQEAYRGLLPRGRYPVVVLEVRLDPLAVDVNVHPSKTEVRFHSPRDLVRVVSEGLREAIVSHGFGRAWSRGAARSNALEQATPTLPWAAGAGEAPPVAAEPRTRPEPPPPSIPAHPDDDAALAAAPPPARSAPLLDEPWSPRPPNAGTRPEVPAPPDAPPPSAPRSSPAAPPPLPDGLLPVARFADLRLVGHLSDRFLVCEGAGELVVVDADAARQRIVRDRLARSENSRGRRLLAPVVVELPRADAERLRPHLPALERLHLDLEPFGGASFAVRSVPEALGPADLPALVAALAGSPSLDEDDVHALMARHARGEPGPPTAREMRDLLSALDALPDGPPAVARLTVDDLERRLR